MSYYNDKEFNQLLVSVSKALNPIETPLKPKHARAAIIGTHQTRGAGSFWIVGLRQPLQHNRITAWKFCHLLHKVLREGHPSCCQQSIRHCDMLIDMGKLWGHLNDGYGLCIRQYTKFLVTKIQFHTRNPHFPGHLQLKPGDLEHFGGNDINIYFQLAVEMFDYLDDIIALQATIFNAITTFRINSMTEPGQCRLAPLIPLIHDSNPLYDFVVRIMFRLHSSLPNDVLGGHRDRFRAIFTQLNAFYNQSKALQYFVDLIKVPKLPDHAPNFSSKVDFGEYKAPVVVELVPPEPEPEVETDLVENLIDTSDNAPPMLPPDYDSLQRNSEPPADIQREMAEKDNLITQLQFEVQRLSEFANTVRSDHDHRREMMETQMQNMNDQLYQLNEELAKTRTEKLELESRVSDAERIISEEDKAKQTEEKFNKLKTTYTGLRDEHVKLIRQHAEVNKEMLASKKQAEELQHEVSTIKTQFEDLQRNHDRVEETLQQSSSSHQGLVEELESKFNAVASEHAELQKTYQSMMDTHQAKIDELETTILKLQDEQSTTFMGFEKVNVEKDELQRSINMESEKNKELQDKLQEAQTTIEELSHKVSNYVVNDEKMQQSICDYESQSASLQSTLNDLENEKKTLETSRAELEEKYNSLSSDFEEITLSKNELDSQLTSIRNEKESLISTITSLEERGKSLEKSNSINEDIIRNLLETCIKTSKELAMRNVSDGEIVRTGSAGSPTSALILSEELQNTLGDLVLAHQKYMSENTNVDGFANKVMLIGYLFATIQDQISGICNTSAEIDFCDKIAAKLVEWHRSITTMYESLEERNEVVNVERNINTVQDKLKEIHSMIRELVSKDMNVEAIGDLVEKELQGMDKSIEEAAARIEEMLSRSRTSDSGIKLEVNEKILDACTNLMKAIKILIQRARVLQEEIVAKGKGSATVKEFYKRNHQWTEGLISAAKSVAQGANFLVDASNKAVSGDVKHQFDFVVAAQEIAACTVQLVVSSRVKAPKGSQNMVALSQASKNVSSATGAVVATAKDCTKRLEDSQDLDLTKLSLHQARRMDMEMQVKVLELEQSLVSEREKLAAFRKKHYHEN